MSRRRAGNFLRFNPHLDPFNGKITGGLRGSDHPPDDPLYTLAFSACTASYGSFAAWSLASASSRPHGLRPGETAYVRFVSFHRIGHTIMMASFLGLALTGLPLKCADAAWAKSLARRLGGFQTTGFWHRFFGVILLASLAVYTVRMLRLLVKGRRQGRSSRDDFRARLASAQSPRPQGLPQDAALVRRPWAPAGAGALGLLGEGRLLGAIADTVIIGTSGLMLWFPDFFCGVLPGKALNLAQVVHSTQALLATGFVFSIHFFNVHLRPDKFPGDLSVLTGLVSEEEFKAERPDYFRRLEREGKLDAMRAASPGLLESSASARSA